LICVTASRKISVEGPPSKEIAVTESQPHPAPPHSHERELIAKYTGRAPRYTSYPTAAQFTPEVGHDTYRAWLSQLSLSEPASLYVHIPFCQRLCWFCGCNTRVVNKPDLVARYVDVLYEELALLEAALPGKLPLANIHLGGGTPNMLSRDDLLKVFSTIRHVFDVRPGAEISVEADPASLTNEWVRAAAYHGVNRVSLGVQELDPTVQRAVNRQESFGQIEQAVNWLRAAGIDAINIDLMYGLPHQTTHTLRSTIRQIAALQPARVALFGYAHVPWMKPHQMLIPERTLPDAAQRLDQADAAAEALEAAGYRQVGLDHFALPADSLAQSLHSRRMHRNFQGYTTDGCDTLLAIGASGIGKLPQGFVQNQSTEIAWRACVQRGELPIARGVAVTPEDRFRSDIIESLMCFLGVDLAAACARHDRHPAWLSAEREALRDLERDGLVELSGDLVHVTERGRPFLRVVCAVFDQYLRASSGPKHAQVI